MTLDRNDPTVIAAPVALSQSQRIISPSNQPEFEGIDSKLRPRILRVKGGVFMIPEDDSAMNVAQTRIAHDGNGQGENEYSAGAKVHDNPIMYPFDQRVPEEGALQFEDRIRRVKGGYFMIPEDVSATAIATQNGMALHRNDPRVIEDPVALPQPHRIISPSNRQEFEGCDSKLRPRISRVEGGVFMVPEDVSATMTIAQARIASDGNDPGVKESAGTNVQDLQIMYPFDQRVLEGLDMRFQPLKIRVPGGIYMIPDYISETDKTELQEELPAIELWNRLKHMRCRKTPISCARNYKSIDENEEEEEEEEELEEEDCSRPKLLKQNPSPPKDLDIPPSQIDKWTGKNWDMDSITAREKVKQTLQHFRDLCKDLHKEAKCRRIDCEAMKIIKHNPESYVHEKYIGHVPGVEIGDEFCYRIELAIIGLHKPLQAGIDYIKHRGGEICTSVVACGCGDYMNDMKNVELLIYSGHGGNIGRGRKEAEDQKLRAGNLALKNSIGARNPVRVIRGSKGIGEGTKVVSTYIYDGLYVVETYWQEAGRHGKLVFKFRLRRIYGQPKLTESQWRKLGRL